MSVLPSGADLGLATVNECATTVRAAELLRLSQARRSWCCSERINGAGQRIQDAYLEPFSAFGSKVFVCHPAREFRHAFGLALAADDRVRLRQTVALGGQNISRRGSNCVREFLRMVVHVVHPSDVSIAGDT